jgi:tetratricopeptide (TPR) repeat protein
LLFEGRSKEALKTAEEAALYAVEQYCGPSKAVEAPRFRHLPWLTYLRYGQWDKILNVPKPAATNDFVMDRAIWHFTRGLAFAAQRNAEPAAQEHAELSKLVESGEIKKMDSPILPATAILHVADSWLAGKVAEARGDHSAMIKHLKEAVAKEDAMPYMEPAFWPLPVRPTLGAALLKAGDAQSAEQVFREDLKQFPRNAWGLLGLEKSLHAQEKTEAAETVKRQFGDTWKQADTALQLAWF